MLLIEITLNMKVMEINTKLHQLKIILIKYLNDLIDDLKTQGEWKIQLTMAINFFSSSKNSKERVLCIQ